VDVGVCESFEADKLEVKLRDLGSLLSGLG